MIRLSFSQAVTPYQKPLATLLLLAGCIGSSYAATYFFEPNNSNVRFEIDHFNTSTNTGGFYNLTGQLQYDPRAKTGSVSLVIPINSLNTGNKAFDLTLTGPDFFDMAKFPLASFESTKWHFADANIKGKAGTDVAKVDGNLTMHGITNPITLTATKFNCYFSFIAKKSVCGGDFTTTIDRTKWGMSKYTLLGITEKVTLNIQIEAAKQ
ncbi:polyisoprenoid-binding protein [Psychrobacter frigidicola]|uniref:Polyisoprenoid-binding protein n=1 Tax=Psychrobacter frigidicola TaxID=45611 RepID=A0A5C6ZYV7_9GAMM|nr:YceI family protein [Psychrobacter frigidicola]TXD96263.1 polyisoprenoid-binding protein [Psychrobacter frigidicola]